MTRRQSQLLAFLRERILANGFSPSFEEMRVHLGYASKSRVFIVINDLEKIGLIKRIPNTARSITVVGIGDYDRGYRDGLAQARRSEAAA